MEDVQKQASSIPLPLGSEDFAKWLDENDDLKMYQDEFFIPERKLGK